ncbi:MAG: response regulator [Clostridiales bacterium]|jgi:signal transduction histidine kinase/CheY-like chemotaxis protein/HPt (histidine-containing phosphotransfer) domain-containing protein|nr:response regulator [Clostridiales bacterium]
MNTNAKRNILRVYAGVITLALMAYPLGFWRTEGADYVINAYIVAAAVCLICLFAAFVFVGDNITLRTSIIFVLTLGCSFFYGYLSGHLLGTPLTILIVTLALSVLGESKALFCSVAFWHIAYLIFFLAFPEVMFSMGGYVHGGSYISIFLILEGGVVGGLLFIAWLNANMRRNLKIRENADAQKVAKSEFLANTSHELRTPVSAMLGITDMIIRPRRAVTAEEIREEARQIKGAGLSLVNLLNDILEVNKITHGKLELYENPYNVTDLVDNVVTILRVRLTGRPVVLLTELHIKHPVLVGDANRLRQVVMNVLSNAVKYTPKGHILLKVEQLHALGGIDLVVSVTDTGIGIREADLTKLFKAFNRVDVTATRAIEGTGLGLSITKHILDTMGGTIAVQSEYGKGSTFTISIPQAIADTQASEELGTNGPERAFSIRRTRALYVDDNETNRTVFSGILGMYELRLEVSASGKEALKMCEENRYDILFTDIMMPEMDGFRLAAALRSSDDPWCRKMPIVAVSASAMSGMQTRCQEAGMNAFLSKPVELSALEKVLRKLIRPDNIVEVKGDRAAKAAERATYAAKLRQAARDVELPGVDPETGIRNCGGTMLAYKEVLKVFYHNAARQIDVIRGAFDTADYERVGIEIHALKSAARGIGATALGDFAANMEQACKDRNVSYLNRNIDAILGDYRTLAEGTAGFLGIVKKQEAAAPAEAAEDGTAAARLKQSLLAVIAAAEGYDLAAAEDALAAVAVPRAPALAALIEEIRAATMQFSYDKTIEKAQAALQLLNEPR